MSIVNDLNMCIQAVYLPLGTQN